MKYDLVCGSLDQNVDEVIYDSRKARPDSVFVCIQGSTRDSHEFIPATALYGGFHQADIQVQPDQE